MSERRPSPGQIFAEHYFGSRNVVAAIGAAGLSTGDEEADLAKGLALLEQSWCQVFLIDLYKEVFGVPDLDARSAPPEVQDELTASTLEVKQTLTRILRDPNAQHKDRVSAAKLLEEIKREERTPPSQADVANRIKDALGIPR